MPKGLQPAVAYLRTSSAANVGADKDSDKRQRAAIDAFAKHVKFTIVDEYYDAAVSDRGKASIKTIVDHWAPLPCHPGC